MTKSYNAPQLIELGAVQQMTAVFGGAPRPDFSTLPGAPPAQGSFDVCPNNTPGQC